MLPGLSGIDVCRAIRAESGTPIIMLTAKTDTVDVVLGLESGADDYVVKPFKPKELVARMRARLRHHEDVASETLTIGPPTRRSRSTSPATRCAGTASRSALTPLEFDLLVALARKPRQVFTREVLLEQVWGYRHAADTRLVNVHVQRLRPRSSGPGAARGGADRPRRRVQGRHRRDRRRAGAPADGRDRTGDRCRPRPGDARPGWRRCAPAGVARGAAAPPRLAPVAAAAGRRRRPSSSPVWSVLVIGLFLVDKVSAACCGRSATPSIDQAKIGLAVRAEAALGRSTRRPRSRADPARRTCIPTSSGAGAGPARSPPVCSPSGAAAISEPRRPHVPAALRTVVQRGNLAVQYAPVPDAGGLRAVPGLDRRASRAAPAPAPFELYYLFPLPPSSRRSTWCSGPCCSPGSRWCCWSRPSRCW